jgi:hypothetical protein
MRPSIRELDTRACDQVFDCAGNQHLLGMCRARNARPDMHRDAADIVTNLFAFAGMQAGADL